MYRYAVKHKVFISFYHYDDQRCKDYVDAHLSDNIINKSVKAGEYDPDDSDEYIKRLIREDKISDSSVVVVLVGPNTKGRKHVDWEIYAGLRASVNGRSGPVGIMLPSHPAYQDGSYKYTDAPARLADNIRAGYAKMYVWDYAVKHFDDIVREAFDNRIDKAGMVDNSR